MSNVIPFPEIPVDPGALLRQRTDQLEAGANFVEASSLQALAEAQELHRRLTHFPWLVEDTDPPEPAA